jgi:hypothetical protein
MNVAWNLGRTLGVESQVGLDRFKAYGALVNIKANSSNSQSPL